MFLSVLGREVDIALQGLATLELTIAGLIYNYRLAKKIVCRHFCAFPCLLCMGPEMDSADIEPPILEESRVEASCTEL